MTRYWLMIIVAAIFEIVWVTGLKYADSTLEKAGTVVGIIVSFALLIHSGKKLPASTAYAVFVGLGTAGTVITEMVWFGVPVNWMKIGLILTLLAGVIGLKTITDQQEKPDGRRENA